MGRVAPRCPEGAVVGIVGTEQPRPNNDETHPTVAP